MFQFRSALMAATILAISLPTTTEAQIFNRRARAEANSVVNEIPRCTQSLGTVTISESQNTMFRQMELSHSTDVLRYLIRESGCFRLIERGAGMELVERERGLGAAGRVRTADFVLVAELANHIEADTADRGSSLLGTLTSVGSRAAVAAMSGGGSEIAGMATMVTRGANRLMQDGGNRPEPTLNQRTVRAIEDLAKDIRKGDQDAQMVFSLTSVPLAETVSYNRSSANRKDMRDLKIRDNHFNGRVGGGFESEDAGKIIALAMVRGYADMVISLGGTGSTTPDVVIANREALEASETARREELVRAERAEQAERSRAEQQRLAEENRIREEIRREERARLEAQRAADNL